MVGQLIGQSITRNGLIEIENGGHGEGEGRQLRGGQVLVAGRLAVGEEFLGVAGFRASVDPL